MSVAESPDCLFRPEDKALKMLFPSVEDAPPSSFDDYFNAEYNTPSDHSDADLYRTIDDYFKNEALAIVKEPSIPARDKSPPQPWRKGLWCLNSKTTAELLVPKTRQAGYQSDANTLTEKIAVKKERVYSGSISPDMRSHIKTKEYPQTPQTVPYRQDVTREMTLSPTPMYARLPTNGPLGHHDTWQQDFENFNLQRSPDRLGFSPPVVSEQFHYNQTARQLNIAVMAHHNAMPPHHVHYRHLDHDDIDPGLMDPVVTTQSQDVHYQVPPPPQYIQHNPEGIVWTTESVHSSNSNSSYPSTAPSSHKSYEFIASQPVTYPHNSWFSTSMQPHALSPISPQAYYPTLAAPKPQRIPHQILQQPPSGLGIQYPDLEQIGQALPYHPPERPPELYHGMHEPPTTTSYPPLPALPPHTFSQDSPFTTPRRLVTSPQRSPSPLSPTMTTTPRSTRHRSPSRPETHRRKSIHKTGPIKSSSDDPIPTTKSTRSPSRAPRTPKTPKTPRTPTTRGKIDVNKVNVIDFINYTEKDSHKLLSDVAPSGSSKTRARREAEAKFERQKFSEAAYKAVKRAGAKMGLEELVELERAIRAESMS